MTAARSLYVYYQCDGADDAAVRVALQQLAALLRDDALPAPQLHRRADALGARCTWMEVYGPAPAELIARLAQSIATAVDRCGLQPLLRSPRRSELFDTVKLD